MSLVSSLGVSYFREWVCGAAILYEGQPHYIMDAGQTQVALRPISPDGRSGSRTSFNVDADWFTGWKVLEYPLLGYRIINGLCYTVNKRQSAHRGIRQALVSIDASPFSAMVEAERASRAGDSVRASRPAAEAILHAVLLPNFHVLDDFDKLVAGEIAAFVPNENICIEPSLTTDTFNILYRTKPVGSVTKGKVFNVNNAAVAKELAAIFGS